MVKMDRVLKHGQRLWVMDGVTQVHFAFRAIGSGGGDSGLIWRREDFPKPEQRRSMNARMKAGGWVIWGDI